MLVCVCEEDAWCCVTMVVVVVVVMGSSGKVCESVYCV